MKYIKKYEKFDRSLYSNVCHYFDNIFNNINSYKLCLYSSDDPNYFYFELNNSKNLISIFDFLNKNKIKIIFLHKRSVLELEIYLTDEQMIEYAEIYANTNKYNL